MRGVSAKDVDGYLASIPEDARAALGKLREPSGRPSPRPRRSSATRSRPFKYRGRPLVSFGAAKEHCSFYVMSPDVVEAHAADLEGYVLGKARSSSPPPSRFLARS
jgi:uncharacterized protein YdhG (YjbR/CyaY superfamily)